MLNWRCFFDSRDVDSSNIIHSLENTISSESKSFHNNSHFLESKWVFCCFHKVSSEHFCSIWSTLLRSFKSFLSCSSSNYFISLRVSKGDDCIVEGSLYMNYSDWEFNILLFLSSSCHWWRTKWIKTRLPRLFLKYWSYSWSSEKFLCSFCMSHRTLSSYWESYIVSHSSVTFDFFESLDVTCNFSSEIVFKGHLLKLIRKCFFLFITEVLHLRLSMNIELIEDTFCHRTTDTIDFGKLDTDWSFICEEMSLYSEHEYYFMNEK